MVVTDASLASSNRLRDLTTESESESKKKIEALEKELDLSSDLQGTPAIFLQP